jgi:rRNA-processing protein FCF1
LSTKKLKVILDSNIFFIPSQFNLNLFEELKNVLNRSFEPVVLSSTLKELQGIQKSVSIKEKKQATIALALTSKCRRMNIEKNPLESYDDVILRVAQKNGWCVVTNDRTLRKQLREKGIPVIYLRQKNHLVIEGNI